MVAHAAEQMPAVHDSRQHGYMVVKFLRGASNDWPADEAEQPHEEASRYEESHITPL
jgi:hypothetical protein